MALANEMNLYNDYIKEIEERKGQGLHPKPIDRADLLNEIIAQIKDTNNANREDCLKFLSIIHCQEPLLLGAKSKILKEIILGQEAVAEITPTFAF